MKGQTEQRGRGKPSLLSYCLKAAGLSLAGIALAGCSPAEQNSAPTAKPAATEHHAMNETKVSATEKSYGTLPDGTEVKQVTLTNANGIEVEVISYGGIITKMITPDAKGNMKDIALGFDTLEEYIASKNGNPYFGALIGRYGNRIADGKFTLDGKEYTLATNDGDNHLHGGKLGFDQKVWGIKPFVKDGKACVELTLTSPDGEEGYPGTLETKVVYELTADNKLDMQFTATTDKPTIVNLTQHSYFNLADSDSILDQQIQINADQYTPTRPGLIPTGEVAAVEGTPFDFRQPKAIGKDINVDNEQLTMAGGFDHNFVLRPHAKGELVLAAKVSDPVSGRALEVLTDEPAIQFYSGNFLDGSLKGKGKTYGKNSGFALEPQHNPDSPNHPEWPTTELRPGETYQIQIVYHFTTI
ncbi:aldose epimerase family protein [Shewanella avicenniae]|nr:aldose epimerase family protein [Shewanella avicenniae]